MFVYMVAGACMTFLANAALSDRIDMVFICSSGHSIRISVPVCIQPLSDPLLALLRLPVVQNVSW